MSIYHIIRKASKTLTLFNSKDKSYNPRLTLWTSNLLFKFSRQQCHSHAAPTAIDLSREVKASVGPWWAEGGGGVCVWPGETRKPEMPLFFPIFP